MLDEGRLVTRLEWSPELFLCRMIGYRNNGKCVNSASDIIRIGETIHFVDFEDPLLLVDRSDFLKIKFIIGWTPSEQDLNSGDWVISKYDSRFNDKEIAYSWVKRILFFVQNFEMVSDILFYTYSKIKTKMKNILSRK